MYNWVKEVIGVDKAMIGLCHILALPGDPRYDKDGGMDKIYEVARNDVLALQEGGIDAIQFTNEFSLPYSATACPETVAAMATIIGQLKADLKVPFGTNVIADTKATIGLCAATGAKFTRGTYHGTYATNSGLNSADAAEIFRLRHNLGVDDLKLVHYINPENSADIAGRDPIESFKPYYFLNKPDAIGVAGNVAGQKVDTNIMLRCRETFPDAVIFAVTGIKLDNVEEVMATANAAFVGTSLKVDGIFENPVDAVRVKALMDKVRSLRGR